MTEEHDRGRIVETDVALSRPRKRLWGDALINDLVRQGWMVDTDKITERFYPEHYNPGHKDRNSIERRTTLLYERQLMLDVRTLRDVLTFGDTRFIIYIRRTDDLECVWLEPKYEIWLRHAPASLIGLELWHMLDVGEVKPYDE